MNRRALASALLTLTFGCSSLNGSSSDAGAEGATGNGGTVSAKSATSSGTAASGSITINLANDSNLAVDSLTEARITVGSGEIPFSVGCTKCNTTSDSWCLGPTSTKAVKIDFGSLDATGSQRIGTTCRGTATVVIAKGDAPSASTADVPLSVTLTGTLTDGSKWVATATVAQ